MLIANKSRHHRNPYHIYDKEKDEWSDLASHSGVIMC